MCEWWCHRYCGGQFGDQMVYGYREGFAAIAVMEVVTMLRVSLWALALGLCAVVSVTSMSGANANTISGEGPIALA